MEKDLLEKCHFYKLDGGNVDVCVYASGEWEESVVAIRINSDILFLRGESNAHQGEKNNRKIIANIVANDFPSTIPLNKISFEETSSMFREKIEDYFRNQKQVIIWRK